MEFFSEHRLIHFAGLTAGGRASQISARRKKAAARPAEPKPPITSASITTQTGGVVNPRSSAAAVQRASDPYYQSKAAVSATAKGEPFVPEPTPTAGRTTTDVFRINPRRAEQRKEVQDVRHQRQLSQSFDTAVQEKQREIDEAEKLFTSPSIPGDLEKHQTEQSQRRNQLSSLMAQSQRVRRGFVEPGDVDAQKSALTQFTEDVSLKSVSPDFQKEQLAKYGFPEDGSDPFGEMRDFVNKSGRSAWINTQISPGPGGDPGRISQRRQAIDKLEKMDLYDKITAGEYVTPEDQAAIETQGSDLDILERGLAEERERAQRGTEAGITKPTFEEPEGEVFNTSSMTRGVMDSVIAQSTPETAQFLTAAAGILDQRMAGVTADFEDDFALANAEFRELGNIIGEMQNRADSFASLSEKIAESNMRQDEILAESQKKSLLRSNNLEREMTRYRMNQQKRELEKANKKRVESLANRVAVAGGFGSMNNLAEIDRIEFEGEQAISNFVVEAGFLDKEYANKASEIEEAYTSTLIGIHRNYSDNLLQIVSKYNDKSDQITNLLRGGSQRRFDAYKTARSTLRTDWIKLQEQTISLMQIGVQSIEEGKQAFFDNRRKSQNELWDRITNVWSSQGTRNKELLNELEEDGRRLGMNLPAGSLSAVKTDAELRELRLRGKGVGGASADIGRTVGEERNKVKAEYPGATPEMIDNLVYSRLYGMLGSKKMADVRGYMADNPLDGERYPLPTIYSSNDAIDTYNVSVQMLEDWQMLEEGTLTPGDIYNSMTSKDLIPSKRLTPVEALNYLGKLGYITTEVEAGGVRGFFGGTETVFAPKPTPSGSW